MSHPEDFCQECGRENPVWWVDNDIWNAVMGTPDNPRGEGNIVCPSCFARFLAFRERSWRSGNEALGFVAVPHRGKRKPVRRMQYVDEQLALLRKAPTKSKL